MSKPRKQRRHNPIARDLMQPKYRLRIVRPRKGKASYSRKKLVCTP